ncbi:MAG TPA: hypothetical protein VII23_18920 [Terriglobales bacterium]
MIRKVLMAAFVLILSLSAVGQGAPTTPTVVPEAGLKKVVPENYFFRGMSATTQLRNSSAIHYPDDFYVIIGLVDTSGYSTDVKAKYNGLFITEKTLKFGSSTLGPGQYGMGYTADGKFHIMNVAGDELLVADITVDDKLARPQPLKIVMDGATARLYLGKKYVTFTAQ